MRRVGYIFSECEIKYLSKNMGADHLVDFGLGLSENNEDITETAPKSLINKNYLFKDFSDKLILNNEIAELIRPFTFPDKIVAFKFSDGCIENHITWYIKDKNYVKVQKDTHMDNNYIFTGDKCSLSFVEDIFDELYMSIKVHKYKGQRIVVDLEDTESINDIWGENYGYFSFIFYGDYKNSPQKSDSLIYFFNERGCCRGDYDYESGKTIFFTPVDLKEIKRNINLRLKKYFGIESFYDDQLFG